MHNTAIDSAYLLIAVGGIFLVGLTTDFIAKRSGFPRITLLMLFGVLIGEQGLSLMPTILLENFAAITDLALLVVGFLLGGQFNFNELKQNSKALLWISASAALVTAIAVTLGLIFSGLPLPVIFLLGCIASATAPAPIIDVIMEANDDSPFAKLLLRIVAIDDVWALILFSVGLAAMSSYVGATSSTDVVFSAIYQIGGAVLLGIVLGYPAAYLTGRIQAGQPTLVEALGLVLVCGGLSMLLDLPYLISVMVMGAMIANLASHHDYPFHEIENIEWPFMMVFFVLAGASLEFKHLASVGFIGIAYIVLRTFGKWFGSWLGATLSGSSSQVKNWMGVALLPQAGVPIGMALIAADQFPGYANVFVSIVVGATVIFELVGPAMTKIALKRAANE